MSKRHGTLAVGMTLIASSILACSAGPGSSEPEGKASDALLCSVHGPCPTPPAPPPAEPAYCKTVDPRCSWTDPLGSLGWSDVDAPDYPGTATRDDAFIAAMQNAGCVAPGYLQWPAYTSSTGVAVDQGGGLVAVCPGAILSTPAPDGNWADYLLPCDACLPPAGTGWVNILWHPGPQWSGGCKNGSCSAPQ
jgi:hypothetical protein